MNGPKAILVFNFAFFNNSNIEATIPPIINDKINQVSPFSNPNHRPKAIASLTSPRPIPRPLVIRYKVKSNKEKKKPESKLGNRE